MPHNLSYPLDVEGDAQQGHYIMFMINETESPKVGKGKRASIPDPYSIDNVAAEHLRRKNFIGTHLNQGAGRSDFFGRKRNMETYRTSPEGAGLYLLRPGTTRLAQAITLYMPPSVKVNYTSNYKDDDISVRASGVAAVTSSLIDVYSGQGTGQDVGAAVAEGAGQAAVSFAAAAANTFGPGAVTLAQLSSGAILGSKMEVMFEGVGRRNFSFQFNFIPKSEKEARMVYDIVQTFKHHMLPEYITELNLGSYLGKRKLGQGRVLKIPDTFDISYFFHNNENPFLNRISTCYLKTMDIDYGGEKYVTYEPIELDGQIGPPPQRTNITLNFTEIETITRERAAQGF